MLGHPEEGAEEALVAREAEDVEDRHLLHRVLGDVEAGPPEERDQIEAFAMRLLAAKPTTERELTQASSATRKVLKITPRRSQLLVLPLLCCAVADDGTIAQGCIQRDSKVAMDGSIVVEAELGSHHWPVRFCREEFLILECFRQACDDDDVLHGQGVGLHG